MLETQLRRRAGLRACLPCVQRMDLEPSEPLWGRGPRTREGAPGPGLQPCQHFKPNFPTVMPLRHLPDFTLMFIWT